MIRSRKTKNNWERRAPEIHLITFVDSRFDKHRTWSSRDEFEWNDGNNRQEKEEGKKKIVDKHKEWSLPVDGNLSQRSGQKCNSLNRYFQFFFPSVFLERREKIVLLFSFDRSRPYTVGGCELKQVITIQWIRRTLFCSLETVEEANWREFLVRLSESSLFSFFFFQHSQQTQPGVENEKSHARPEPDCQPCWW